MSKKKFEEQLERLELLREADAADATAGIRKALRNRNNYLVSKAARIAGDLGLRELIPELAAAMERFFDDAVKTDPQCWAKNALAESLAGLGYDEPELFVRGLRHVQMEPVMGGRSDSATALRGICALALVGCRQLSDHQVLQHLVEALADTGKTVRVEAARAIGRMNRPEAALLLRLKALLGDREPEVMGACFSALLEIEGTEGIPFVARYLEPEERGEPEEAAGEAALALGATHDPSVVPLLRRSFETRAGLVGDPWFGGVLLTAMALSNLPEALEFLIATIAGNGRFAPDAVRALGSARVNEEWIEKTKAAAESSGNARLRAAVRERFP